MVLDKSLGKESSGDSSKLSDDAEDDGASGGDFDHDFFNSNRRKLLTVCYDNEVKP